MKKKEKEVQNWQVIFKAVTGKEIDMCPHCKTGTMITIETLPALRSRDGP